MKLLLKILLIFILIFVFLGPFISFMQPFHKYLYIRFRILEGDFLSSITLYKDALTVYENTLPLCSGNLGLTSQLMKKIDTLNEAINKYNSFLEEGFQGKKPRIYEHE